MKGGVFTLSTDGGRREREREQAGRRSERRGREGEEEREKRRGWIWGQPRRQTTHFKLFFERREVSKDEWKNRNAVSVIGCELLRGYLAAWSRRRRRRRLCEPSELGCAQRRGRKTRVGLLSVCLAVFTSAASDQWTCNLELCKPFKHIIQDPSNRWKINQTSLFFPFLFLSFTVAPWWKVAVWALHWLLCLCKSV